MNRILIVEDEAHIADGLRYNLEAEGFEAEIAADGRIALQKLSVQEDAYAAIVLDVMLPEIDGFEVARKLRESGDFTPILMLTARNRPEDVLQGFEAGADDYLPKPFELSIFLARLNGLLRRQKWMIDKADADVPTDNRIEKFEIHDKTVDFQNLELRSDRKTIRLTLMEANLLRHLIENEGKAVSRKEILEEVWGLNEETDTRAIDNFIVRLRRHLEVNPSKPKILETVRGVGYRFVGKEKEDV